MARSLISLCILLCLVSSEILIVADPDNNTHYEPDWNSLDKRPLPRWYDAAKVGIFIHWGVFSVPSFGSEWFWKHLGTGDAPYVQFMRDNYPKSFTYQDFARDLTAEFYNASEWAELFKKSGANYVVLTSKHHEGYTLWPSQYSFSWNAMDVGPHRDLVGELAEAVKKENLHFGLYHSMYEWYNPLYQSDKANKFATQVFVNNKCMPELKELVSKYQPEVLWSDGDWEAPDHYWKSTEFLAWLYNESPVKDTVVVNDRWGSDTSCKHGDFYNCKDRFNPGVLQKHKWENALTIDRLSWGFRRNAKLSDFITIETLLTELVSTVSCGGNMLINVGPTKDGIIAPIFQERLLQLGEWLSINGEAIYQSTPWKYQNDTYTPGVWYTAKNNAVYVSVLHWPTNNILKLSGAFDLLNSTAATVRLLGDNQPLEWKIENNLVDIYFPDKATVKGRWAWSLKIF